MFSNGCWHIILISVVSWRLCRGDGHHQSAAAVETKAINSGECEWVTLPLCQAVVRSWTNFPNLLGHTNQREVANSSEYRFLKDLSRSFYGEEGNDVPLNQQAELVQRCELQIYQVACSYLVPKCVYLDKIHVTSLPPCQSVCTEVRDRCEEVLSASGLQWPEFLDCESWVQCHLPSVCRHSDVVLGSHSRSGNANLSIRTRRKRKIPKIDFKHHSEREARKTMTRITRHCPNITRLYSVGRSVKGRPLYVMEISDNPGLHEPLEPEFKYVGAIHGNEVLGRELLLQLMQFICREWLLGNERIRSLVTNTRIHLLPTMNPDGYNVAAAQGPEKNGWLTGRFNYRGYDLNRQFPDLTRIMYGNEINFGPNHHLNIPTRYWREHRLATFPEIHSVMQWMKHYDFILSAQLHGGELVANYPYDLRRKSQWHYIYNKMTSPYSKSPDDELFIHLSSTYAQNHRTMADPERNDCEDKFGRKGGITNGAEWYSISGGMQDFNYLHSNCFEILIELSCRKFPPASKLPTEWVNNKLALLKYMEQVHIGVKGFVRDANGIAVKNAVVHVHGIQHDVATNSAGEYWRMLLPGKYIITASKDGKTATIFIFVENRGITAVRHDFVLGNASAITPSMEKPTKLSEATPTTTPNMRNSRSRVVATEPDKQHEEITKVSMIYRLKSSIRPAYGSGHTPDVTGEATESPDEYSQYSGDEDNSALARPVRRPVIHEISLETHEIDRDNPEPVSGDHALEWRRSRELLSLDDVAVTPSLFSSGVTQPMSNVIDDEEDSPIDNNRPTATGGKTVLDIQENYSI